MKILIKYLTLALLVLVVFQNSVLAETGASQSTRIYAPFFHFKDCDTCSEMIVLPSGEFQMGANEEDWGILQSISKMSMAYIFAPLWYKLESPQHAVKVQSFALAQHDVTKAQFAIFAAETKFEGKGCNALHPNGVDRNREADWANPWFAQTDNDPVVCVSWNDVQKYIAWLNSKLPAQAAKYRLPTSAEWEYAARAETTTPSYWGDISKICQFANVSDAQSKKVDFSGYNLTEYASCDDGFPTTSPVGSFPPNPWGLYDMLGNVEQFTKECAFRFGIEAPYTDGCTHHMAKGSSWTMHPVHARAAAKIDVDSNIRTMANGFRLAKDLTN